MINTLPVATLYMTLSHCGRPADGRLHGRHTGRRQHLHAELVGLTPDEETGQLTLGEHIANLAEIGGDSVAEGAGESVQSVGLDFQLRVIKRKHIFTQCHIDLL